MTPPLPVAGAAGLTNVLLALLLAAESGAGHRPRTPAPPDPAELARYDAGLASPALAANGASTSAAAWSEAGQLRIAIRHGSSPWSSPIDVPQTPGQKAGTAQVAVTESGDVAVTWYEGDGTSLLRAAFYLSDGCWSEPMTLSSSGFAPRPFRPRTLAAGAGSISRRPHRANVSALKEGCADLRVSTAPIY